MNVPGQKPSASRPASKLYSVPRRYDLATLFVVSSAYALLFGFLRLVGTPPQVIGFVGLFVTVIGMGQALLFGGRSPRAASLVVGIPAWFVLGFVLFVPAGERSWPPGDVVVGCLCPSVFVSTILSYIVGVSVAGVFLIADKVRRRFEKRPPRENAEGSPWTEEPERTAGEKTP